MANSERNFAYLPLIPPKDSQPLVVYESLEKAGPVSMLFAGPNIKNQELAGPTSLLFADPNADNQVEADPNADDTPRRRASRYHLKEC
ncbi:hypothetical protein HGA88_06025 [Candidatus Roizmanbacteria bacterium]|nr:hypothetical protein [Candidatus Roizmanbacteria bacterium]